MLPTQQRSFQSLAQRLAGQQAEYPIVACIHRVGAVLHSLDSFLHRGAVVASDLDGLVLGIVIDHEDLIARTQRVERTPDALCVILRVQQCAEPQHTLIGCRTGREFSRPDWKEVEVNGCGWPPESP